MWELLIRLMKILQLMKHIMFFFFDGGNKDIWGAKKNLKVN